MKDTVLLLVTQAMFTPSILIDPAIGSMKRNKQETKECFSALLFPISATFSPE